MAESGPVPVSLVKDVLFVVDLLAHAGGGEIDLSIRATPFVIADRWLIRRFLLRSLLPLLPPEPGHGRLRIEVAAERLRGIIRAGYPARIPVSWAEPQKLARELGGSLEAESSSERGTAVTIRLPLAALRPPPAPHAAGAPRRDSTCSTSAPGSRCV